jgi:hypothetical protein
LVVLAATPEEREGRDNRPTTLIQGYSSTLLLTSTVCFPSLIIVVKVSVHVPVPLEMSTGPPPILPEGPWLVDADAFE